jgi:HNH endonuclease
MSPALPSRRLQLSVEDCRKLHKHILDRDGWRRQLCGPLSGIEVHHVQRRSQSGHEDNLITLCSACHRGIHG